MGGKMYGTTWENWLNKNWNFSGRLIAFVWQNFFKEGDAKQDLLYQRCVNCFYKAFDMELQFAYEKYNIPIKEKFLNCTRMKVPHSKGTILVCGGYDSFIEEFVFQVHSPVY